MHAYPARVGGVALLERWGSCGWLFMFRKLIRQLGFTELVGRRNLVKMFDSWIEPSVEE